MIELRRTYSSAVYRVGTVYGGEVKQELNGKGGYRSTQCGDGSNVRCGKRREVCLAANRSQRSSDTQAVQCVSSSDEQIQAYRSQI